MENNKQQTEMNKEFIPYELALELKQLGFTEPCFTWYWDDMELYNNGFGYGNYNKNPNLISAPTYSQAFRWFRERYKLHGCIDLKSCTLAHWFVRVDDIIENDYLYHSEDENLKFETYEEAELECLKELIRIVKNNG
jgi:hypothetical protein